MGHINSSNSEVVRKMGDFELHLFAQLLVQRAKGFVHQHQFRLEHQRPGESHTLLLAPRQLRRTTPTKGTHFHHFKCPLDLGLAVGFANLAHLERKAEVFGNRHVWK